MIEHYKSWFALKKRLEESLCDALKGRIDYFLTSYHKVHNSYGRASIRLDGNEVVCFSWIEAYHQEWSIREVHKKEPSLSYYKIKESVKTQRDYNCIYSNDDFIEAVTDFFNLSIDAAQISDNCIIKILAVLDKRTGKRVLKQIKDSGEYQQYPKWVCFFYELRFETDNI